MKINARDVKYFNEVFGNDDIEFILDSLTKTISRKYIFKYVEYLIANNIEFSLGIIDIDNFKHVNDNYGHAVGDIVLASVADSLMNYVGTNGLVGRYGGDEYVVVLLGDGSYNRVHTFYARMYDSGEVFRKNYGVMSGINALLTATSSSASFPKDATDFKDLLLKADKALYRGKMKGRNCYIIYVHEKHNHIEISRIVRDPVYIMLEKLYQEFTKEASYEKKIDNSLQMCSKYLKISDAFYINGDSTDMSDILFNSNQDNLSRIVDNNGMFICNDLKMIKILSNELYEFCLMTRILSVLICKVSVNNSDDGYIIFGDTRVERIWQEEDLTLAKYLSKLIILCK